MRERKWTASERWLEFREGMLRMARCAPSVPAPVRAAAERARPKIAVEGGASVCRAAAAPEGAAIRVAAGARSVSPAMRRMDWLAEGIAG